MNIIDKICVTNTFNYNNNYYTGLLDKTTFSNIDDSMKTFFSNNMNKVIVFNDYFSCLEINCDKTIFDNDLICEFRKLSDFYKCELNTSVFMEFIILPLNLTDIKTNMKEIFNIIYNSISTNLHQLYDEEDINLYLSQLQLFTDVNTFKIDPKIDFNKTIIFDLENSTLSEYTEEIETDELLDNENDTMIDIL